LEKKSEFFFNDTFIHFKFNEESESGEKKIKKNRPFIKVAHFENTMTNDSKILPGSKKNIPNTPK
jgi:hypothetical protein